MLGSGHPLFERIIKPAKITRYLLDLTSEDGASKARFFMRFGFDPAAPDVLIAALYCHPEQNPIAETWTDAWGTHFSVVGPLDSPDGRNPIVLTAWFTEIGLSSGPPRLVTAYPV